MRLCFAGEGDPTTTCRLKDVVKRRRPPLDTAALAARALGLPPTEPDETPYIGIRCRVVEPPVSSHPGYGAADAASATKALRHALEACIERTLGDARCVAVMAGGGLDSAGLLALSCEWARNRGAKVFAVALDFAGRCDDRPYLRSLERALKVEVVRVRPEDGARHLAWTGGVDAAPLCWPSAPMEIEMMRRARERGADCVLMGVGGDELFDGEPQALAAMAGRGEVLQAIRAARRLRAFDEPASRSFAWVVRPLLRPFVPSSLRLRRARRRRASVPRWAGRALVRYLEAIHARDLRALERGLSRGGRFVDPMHAERYRAYLAWLRHHEEVVAGIERRDPFLDRGLIATVAGFEPEWLLSGGIRRGLFREALRDLLPADLLAREDKAFFEPAFIRMVAAAGGLEAWRDLASCDELAELEFVDVQQFRRAFEAFVAAPDEGLPWMTLWPALCVERFLRASRVKAAA